MRLCVSLLLLINLFGENWKIRWRCCHERAAIASMFECGCARPAPSRLAQCRIVQPPIEASHAVASHPVNFHGEPISHNRLDDRVSLGRYHTSEMAVQ